MLFSFLFSILALAATALAWVPLFERASPGCNADNCLRAITGTQPGQTQTRANRVGDCSSVMVKTVTPDTVTVTTTISFVSSTTATLLTTTTTATTSTLLATTTSSATLTILTTTTTTAPANVNGKRSAVTVSGTNVPAYASPCSGIARYTSACSCAGVTAKTITVSAPTVTSTVSATSSKTIIVLSTSTSVSIALVTSTETDFTTSSITSTSTSVVIPAPAGCTPAPGSDVDIKFPGGGVRYIQQFTGVGVSRNINIDHDGSTSFPGSLTDCDAISACGDYALNVVGAPSFDIHYMIAEKSWSCNAYATDDSVGSEFTSANSDIGVVYGYGFERYD